jgi:hypothetical protein
VSSAAGLGAPLARQPERPDGFHDSSRELGPPDPGGANSHRVGRVVLFVPVLLSWGLCLIGPLGSSAVGAPAHPRAPLGLLDPIGHNMEGRMPWSWDRPTRHNLPQEAARNYIVDITQLLGVPGGPKKVEQGQIFRRGCGGNLLKIDISIDEPGILSYAISSFCPTSADGLHSRGSD